MQITVIIPTHNPEHARLQRVLGALKAQTLASDAWEVVLVDNGSEPPLDAGAFTHAVMANLRLVHEPQLGLTAARCRGIIESRGDIVVFVDDDNVLNADFLREVTRIFSAHPEVGAIGGKITPEFESKPEPWVHDFFPLLALRDLGAAKMIAGLERAPGGSHFLYPGCAPVGAGMTLRRDAAHQWLAKAGSALPDRRGVELSSSGDNDIVLTLLHAGWKVGYFPELTLTHLIPAARLEPAYLARLNRGIQCSWQRVLARHQASAWPPIPPWTVPMRGLKAWFNYRAWTGPAAHIRWQGACGHFEGRILR